MKKVNRRNFIRNSALAAVGIISAPAILPTSILKAKYTPNNKINIGVIGCGRIARGHDIPETLKNDSARIVAVCDVDAKRVLEGKEFIETAYFEKTGKENYVDVKMYEDFRDLCS